MDEGKWEAKAAFTNAGMGALRFALLFGSAAVALALIAVPLVENQLGQRSAALQPGNLDFMSTGSVDGSRSYTIRRSVLQSSPNAVCIIRDNGRRSGDC